MYDIKDLVWEEHKNAERQEFVKTLIKYFLAIGMFLILDLYLKSSNLRKNNKYEFT